MPLPVRALEKHSTGAPGEWPCSPQPEAVRDGRWLFTDRILHRDEVTTRQLPAVVRTRLTNTDPRLHV